MKATARLLLPLMLSSIALTAISSNWPAWRAPDASGVYLETNLPVEWSASKNVWWKIGLPDRSDPMPIIRDDRIFRAQTVETENRRTMMCFGRSNGKQLCEERLPKQGAKGHRWTSPLLAADKIYAVNESGDVIVFRVGPDFEVVSVDSIRNQTTNASLTRSEGGLFLRTHQHLWCIGGTKSMASLRQLSTLRQPC